MRKYVNLAILLITLGLLVIGITSYTNAYFNATLSGESDIHSAQWKVEGKNYQKFGSHVSFSGIKPGDSGVINIGAKLFTDVEKVPTSVTFNYNIPEGLETLDFYLVDNTSHQAVKIAELSGTGNIDLEVSMFLDTNDLELRWIYPKHTRDGVCGEIAYSLIFSQIESISTLYTDVNAFSLGVFDNVEVTVNKAAQTVSFVLLDESGNIVLTVTDAAYTDNNTYLSLSPADNYPEGIEITNPEVINE